MILDSPVYKKKKTVFRILSQSINKLITTIFSLKNFLNTHTFIKYILFVE